MNVTTNGRVRKSLAEQIDRLDRTLDGLADGLNEAVATAVREALQGVLAELLADAGLRAQLQAAHVAQVAASQPSQRRDGGSRVWHGLIARVQAVHQALHGVAVRTGQAFRQQWVRLTAACSGAWRRTRDLVITGWYGLRIARHVLVALATALAVGGLVSVAAYCAGPTLAAAAAGVLALRWPFARTSGCGEGSFRLPSQDKSCGWPPQRRFRSGQAAATAAACPTAFLPRPSHRSADQGVPDPLRYLRYLLGLTLLAQQRHSLAVGKLPDVSTFSENPLAVALQDNTRSPVPDQVAFRLDFPRRRRSQRGATSG